MPVVWRSGLCWYGVVISDGRDERERPESHGRSQLAAAVGQAPVPSKQQTTVAPSGIGFPPALDLCPHAVAVLLAVAYTYAIALETPCLVL